MRTIRNLFAAMLIGSAAVAFQVDADAQSRNGASRSTTTTRSSNSSSNATRSSSVSTQKKQTVARSSSQTRQSVSRSTGSSSQTRQSSSKASAVQTRPSVQAGKPAAQSAKPSVRVTRPAAQQTRPATQQTRPSVQTRPSTGTPESRPKSGAVTARKPSPTVNRPGYRPGDKKPSDSPVSVQPRPDNRPGQRPGAGSAFKPDHVKQPIKVKPYHKHSGPRVHPVHRDFIAYDRPPHFWTPHYHYFGHRVRVLPSRARVHVHFGVSYYCYNDIWYRPYGGYYVICRPPFGTVLAANLIADMAWTAVKFSYYNTVLNNYRQINENNKFIAEQNEIIAKNNATIAAQNAAIAMNQQQASTAFTLADELGLVQSYAAADGEYFYQDGVFYAKDASGEYKVIVPPAGALVDSLPDDYEMVTLNDTEYYKVDDTVFKVTLNDGKPYFEVLGQMSA